MNVKAMLESPGMSGFDVRAKVEKIFGYNTGEGEYGPYSFQNLMIADETGKIGVVIKNHPQLPESVVGKFIVVKCKSYDGQLRGTQVKVEKYRDDEGEQKSVTKLIITKAASIVVEGAEAPGPGSQSSPAASISADSLVSCLAEAASVLSDPEVIAARDAVARHGWTTEDLRAVALTLAIQRSRR